MARNSPSGKTKRGTEATAALRQCLGVWMVALDDLERTDDAVLARRCAGREEAAWRELLAREGPVLLAALRGVFLRARVPSPDREAEEALGDLVADLLDRDAAALRAYRPASPLRAYLVVLARTTACRILRRRHRVRLEDLARLAAPEASALDEGLPAGAAELGAALAVLAARDRLLLKLVYWQGLSYQRAGRIVALSTESVGPALTRARAALRAILEKSNYSAATTGSFLRKDASQRT